MNYEERLKIPVDGGDFNFYTKSNVLIATGYTRVVIGGRGPYVEFNDSHLIKETIYQAESHYYYNELRTIVDNVKIYSQLHIVDYADYKIGLYYISPFELYNSGALIEPIRKIVDNKIALFD